MLKKYASIIRTLAFIIPALSIIGGLILAVKAENVLLFIYFAVPAFLYYTFTRSYAELLEATEDTQEMVYQIQEQLSQKDAKTSHSASSPIATTTSNKPIANGWTCSCGRNNPTYASTCVCGKNKRDIESAQTVSSEPIKPNEDSSDPNYIICPKCGTRQRSNRSVCFECGTTFK